MKVNELTKRVLAARRQRRDMTLDGYEEITMTFGIGRLWELDRGCRIGWKLVDAKLGVDGRSVYVKAAPQSISEH